MNIIDRFYPSTSTSSLAQAQYYFDIFPADLLILYSKKLHADSYINFTYLAINDYIESVFEELISKHYLNIPDRPEVKGYLLNYSNLVALLKKLIIDTRAAFDLSTEISLEL